jgi:hypothetical protein
VITAAASLALFIILVFVFIFVFIVAAPFVIGGALILGCVLLFVVCGESHSTAASTKARVLSPEQVRRSNMTLINPPRQR